MLFKFLRPVCFLAISMSLTACQAKDEQYYLLHPKQLQIALNQCSSEKGDSSNCSQLQEAGLEVNRLAYTLQASPQAFGQAIITLQVDEVNFTNSLNEKDNPEMRERLKNTKNKLKQYLAIVKWLESPES